MSRKAPTKALKRGSYELGKIIDSCSEIPELVCMGIIAMVKEGGPANKLKQRISTLQAMRAVSIEYQKQIDKFVLQVIKEVAELGQDVFIAKRAYKMAVKKNEDASQIKDLESKWKEKATQLNRTMQIYFPVEVTTEYSTKINSEPAGNQTASAISNDGSSGGAQGCISNPVLHATISMFFAMATQTCYLHTCGGLKRCTKTHSGRSFLPIRYCGGDGRMYAKCIYSSEECLCSLKEDCRAIVPGRLTQISKMAVEMYRRRCIFDIHEIQQKMQDRYLRDRNRIQLVFSHPDIDIPSTQKALEITPQELKQCKDEIKRKDIQRRRVADEMAEVQRRYLMEDVEDVLANNNKYGFESFDALQNVFPGIAGAMKLSIKKHTKEYACLWQIRMVGECFKELAFLMSVVRPEEKHTENGMSSKEAYDFMSGKACGVLAHAESWYTGYGWSCLDLGGSKLLTDKNKPNLLNYNITVATVCASLQLFDKVDGEWNVRINVPKGRVSVYSKSGTKVFETGLGEFRERLFEHKYYLAISEHIKKNFDEDLPIYPLNTLCKESSNNLHFTDRVVEFTNAMFKALCSRPETKFMAMRYIGVCPISLCSFVSHVGNQNILQAIGVAPNPDVDATGFLLPQSLR